MAEAGSHQGQNGSVGMHDPARTARDLADLAALGADLIELAATDVRSLSRQDYAELLVRMANSNEQHTRITGSIADTVDTLAAPCAVGEKSVAALLRAKCRLPRSQTRRLLTAGRARYRFPSFDQAHRDGAVTVGHLEVMADMAGRVDSHQLAAAEPFLCAAAGLSTVEEFTQTCREWEAAADPTEHLDDYLRAQARRHLWFGNDVFGNLHFGGTTDPLQGEVFRNIIDTRTDHLYRTDNAATQTGQHLDRTNSQRRLDALIDLLEDGHGAAPGTKRPEPVLHLLCSCNGNHTDDADCPPRQPEPPLPGPADRYPQTLGGALIPYVIVADLLKTSGRTKIVKVTADQQIIDHTVGGRHFTQNQKRLIDLRDRHCRHPGCTTRWNYCDHDHITPHSRGGPTTVANGQLLCRFHHRWKHRNDPGRRPSRLFEDAPLE